MRVSMVHVLWCPGEDDFKVSSSMYRSHSMVWAVKMEDSELKLLLKQKDFFFFFKKGLPTFVESKTKKITSASSNIFYCIYSILFFQVAGTI